ncbi:unnamed protein product [Fusarium venenatum]|uniref:Uncharacterized protein n=1 Tax=Fusarium venenatum TaxID=56646 RepID=A0A2L2SPZ9_9HYPO|nr:uncharacterized protein FVRRES_12715 [Fusarium venenatum]CEI40024.1 unnamed protein product [Fusarium venenatum]
MPQRYPQTHQDGIWRLTLLSSPWFDCPIFEDLLMKPIGSNDLDMTPWEPGTKLTNRDPFHPELLSLFLDRWWSEAFNWHLRRFDNDDVVLPLTAGYYHEMYGPEAMDWHTIREEIAIKNQVRNDEDDQGESQPDKTFPDENAVDAAGNLADFSSLRIRE